jgi:ABC-type glycerol-3-phosphate transport system substrate-binding protein
VLTGTKRRLNRNQEGITINATKITTTVGLAIVAVALAAGCTSHPATPAHHATGQPSASATSHAPATYTTWVTGVQLAPPEDPTVGGYAAEPTITFTVTNHGTVANDVAGTFELLSAAGARTGTVSTADMGDGTLNNLAAGQSATGRLQFNPDNYPGTTQVRVLSVDPEPATS